jgi:hypothetical protein
MGEESNMKFCKISLFFALLVAVCLPAVGQNALRVDVPFNFIAAGKSLPAGQYTIAPVPTSSCVWYLFGNHTGAMMMTNPADSSQKAHRPKLVFLQAGGTYSLVQIWNWNSGVDVPHSQVKQTLVSKDDSKADKYIEIGAE